MAALRVVNSPRHSEWTSSSTINIVEAKQGSVIYFLFSPLWLVLAGSHLTLIILSNENNAFSQEFCAKVLFD